MSAAGPRLDRARLAHWYRRSRDLLRSTAALASLVVGLLTGRVREIWIGDSHSICFNRSFSTANVVRAPDGVWVFHLGARLMYSVATNGFPRWTRRLVGLTARLGRGRLTVVFCMGDIDVRCHMAKHVTAAGPDTAFVHRFTDVALQLAAQGGFDRIVFFPPPPPCREPYDVESFPIVGTFAERTAAFDALRETLIAVAAESGRSGADVRVVDATPVLRDPEGGMPDTVTDDRCHVNAEGSRRARRVIEAELAA